MHTYSFIMLGVIGIWRPQSFTSKLSIRLYNTLTTINLIVYYAFMVSEILDIVLEAENVQQITENMIQLINIINVSQKNLSYLLKRNKIIKFMDMFFDDIALPRTPKEEVIQKKFDNESRRNSIKLFILYSISVVLYVYAPFFLSKLEDRVLPYRGWRPYSLDNVNYYYLSYIHHSWAVTIAATSNAATETLVSGLMIQICAQFEILEERFMQLPIVINEMRENGEPEYKVLTEEKRLVVRLIRHHLRIYEMAELLNDIFVFVILSQFVASTSVLCVCTYNLALCKGMNSDFFTIFLFLLCMLLQIFLYTWYGNEITLRSIDLGNNIYRCDWRSLSAASIKDIMILFERTTKPILMSSGYVITLSNAAFTSIVKTSYSVFNVLSVN